jgi:hypothetical protein
MIGWTMGISSSIIKANTKRTFDRVSMICQCGCLISGFKNTILICENCNSKFVVCVAELKGD